MTAFDYCRSIEQQSFEILAPKFRIEWSDNGQFVVVEKGRLAKELQAKYGDVFVNKNGHLYTIEIKAERKHTGNLFLESWSNYPVNEGWMKKLDADWLFYHFLDINKLYIINFVSLCRWAFNDWRIYEFRETQQKKYNQPNDTRGYIVPVETLKSELGDKCFIEFSFGQYRVEVTQ